MSDDRTDPLADLFTLFATPLSGAVRSVEQFRKGVDEFLKGVENFNRTMENLNATTERINTLLGEVEAPLRAAVPQVTRTIKTADQLMQVVSGPAMAVAPGLEQLATTLSTPAFAQLPHQLTQFSDVLAELSRRMGPLTTLAESAGGLFGGFRMPGTRPPSPADVTPRSPDTTAATTAPTSATGSPARTSTATTSRAKKSTARKTTARKSTARKSTAKKSTAKKSTAKKSTARKTTASTTPGR